MHTTLVTIIVNNKTAHNREHSIDNIV